MKSARTSQRTHLWDTTRWRQRLHEKLRPLITMPSACGLAPEDEFSDREIRQLLVGSYRLLFTVRTDRVLVLTVRHGARRLMARDEIGAIE